MAKQIRRVILEQAKRAHVGHIGSTLSVADIIAALYGGALRATDPKDPERDRFVLGKGHAMLAVHAALFLKGWLSQEQLNTYCGDGSLLGVHPEYGLRGVDFASGSLGQGLERQHLVGVTERLLAVEVHDGNQVRQLMVRGEHHRFPN